MQFERPKKSNQEVSLIPLINVIFLLLIFFMVAGTVEGIDIFEVDLPKSSEARAKPPIPSIVYLSEDGRIAVNNDIVKQENLKTIISTLFIDNPSQKITVKSDGKVPMNKLVHIMNIIEESGGIEVSLVTQVNE